MHTEITFVNQDFSDLISLIEEQNELAQAKNLLFHEIECHDRVSVVCQNARAIILLSNNSLHFYNSAKILCRTLFEGSAKIGWILEPDSRFEKENRFLALLKEAGKKLTDMKKSIGPNEYYSQERIDEINVAIEKISSTLIDSKPEIKILGGLPPFDQILKALDVEFMYIMYKEMSNEIHASHLSSGTYSTEHGLNEAGITWNWWNIYSLMYFSLLIGPRSYLTHKLGEDNILHDQNHDLEIKIKEILNLSNRIIKQNKLT